MGLLQFWNKSQEYFSPVKELQGQVAVLEKNMQREKLKLALASAQLRDFQESVAVVLPAEKKNQLSGMTDFKMAQISSVVRVPASESLDLSLVYMSRAKSSFRDRKYSQAVLEFTEVIDKFPSSSLAPEAMFMLAESYYLGSKPNESLDIIEQMMTLFPENEMTGFIMLRMGQIFQERRKPEEAAEVYRTVIDQFGQNPSLKKQAEKLLKTTEA